MKKIVTGLLATAATLVVLPMFAAFEAHVINVTAKIENALEVQTESINFGTVFPQEHLERPLTVELSDSFMQEQRVDDVEYFIRQKPKCGVTTDNGTTLAGSTATGHIVASSTSQTGYEIDCGPAPDQMPPGATWGVLPSLCEYLSKEGEDRNDGHTYSFHKPWIFSTTTNEVTWTDTPGRLAKSESDIVDNWIIDLSVPCFGNQCAQDWALFVDEHDGDTNANPDDYVQPRENEHKIFGCDLWVEVKDVSTTE